MSGHEKDATANLEFFRSAILWPTLDLRAHSDVLASTVSDLGAIEAVHWARLGVYIGYFDGKDAQELISSSEGVFQAWSELQNLQIITPEDDWANVIRPGERGEPALNKELFSVATDIAPRTRELLQDTFQIFLLLTSENILDKDSSYFLDSIGWTDDREWNVRREGMVLWKRGSVQQIGAGFANVLNYWEEMFSSSRSAEDREAEFTHIDSLDGLAPKPQAPDFTQYARAILSRRFNLGKTEIVDRYFMLAGEFANRAREDSPAWLDARVKVFEKLLGLITYAGGGASMSGHEALWSVFTNSIESSPVENKTSPHYS